MKSASNPPLETTHLIRRACAQIVQAETLDSALAERAASNLVTKLDGENWSERYRMTGQLELLPASEIDEATQKVGESPSHT
jgi:hypothetical protein